MLQCCLYCQCNISANLIYGHSDAFSIHKKNRDIKFYPFSILKTYEAAALCLTQMLQPHTFLLLIRRLPYANLTAVLKMNTITPNNSEIPLLIPKISIYKY